MKILIQTAESLEIGSGHMQRCLTLAQELKTRGCTVTFENLESDIYDWIIVDQYSLDAKGETSLRKKTKSIMVIDDLANRKHDCDLLLDQNAYENQNTRYEGKIPKNAKTLLGPQYALLRKEFSEIRKKTGIRKGEIKSIFICYGGSDKDNETLKAMKAVDNIPTQVVIGPQNPHFESLKRFAAERPYFTLQKNPPHMAQLMSQADLAFGGGGTMTWERCALGLPCIVTILAENQKEVALYGQKLGFQIVTSNNHAEILRRLQENPQEVHKMSKSAWQTVDAEGTQRVVEHILK